MVSALTKHGPHNIISPVLSQEHSRLAYIRKLRLKTLSVYEDLTHALYQHALRQRNVEPVHDDLESGLDIWELAARFTGLRKLHLVIRDDLTGFDEEE